MLETQARNAEARSRRCQALTHFEIADNRWRCCLSDWISLKFSKISFSLHCATKRVHVEEVENDLCSDPRFLVFEFTRNLILRPQQVRQVLFFSYFALPGFGLISVEDITESEPPKLLERQCFILLYYTNTCKFSTCFHSYSREPCRCRDP